MTPTLALLAALTATAQEAPAANTKAPHSTVVYAGAHSSWVNGWSRSPLSGGVDVVALLPQVQGRIRIAAYQQPGDELQAALNAISEAGGTAPQPPQRWMGNQASAEAAWRSPVGLLLGGRVARDQAFSQRGMAYLTDELRIAPDHDRAWTAGPTLGALTQTERYDLGAQFWLGLPVTTRMTPGVSYPSPAETPGPRDVISTRAELTGLARYHQGRGFAAVEAGMTVRQRTRYQREVLALGNAPVREPVLRISAGVAI